MRLPAGYAVRPATQDDIPAMVAVANAYDEVDLGRPDTAVEHLAEGFRTRDFDAQRNSWLVLEPRGDAVAFAIVGLEPGSVLEAFGRVRPDHTGRGLGSFLVAATEGRAAELATSRSQDLLLHNAVTSTDDAVRRLLDERGYRLVRFFWHMERALGPTDRTPSSEEGSWVVRPAESLAELREARAVLDDAFRGHWMFEPHTFDEWRDHLYAGSASVLLAVDESAMQGGAITFMPTSESGWIEELGVRAERRGRGLGALLLRHAFARLADRGYREVRLNVDAGNETGATRLYERVGMTVRREWLVHEKRFPEEGGRGGR